MTERKLYRCDVCKTEYANKDDAEKCEKYHVEPSRKATIGFYKGMNQHSCDQYPYKVIVQMADGKGIEYKR